MSGARVCAMMLIADRQAYGERALKCFFQQTYQHKQLFMLDNGSTPFELPDWLLNERDFKLFRYVYKRRAPGEAVGLLRNLACYMIGSSADIIVHWDSDDWSAPERMACQVEDLIISGAECTGYHNLLFWDRRNAQAWEYDYRRTTRALGTSLMYRYATWERAHFHPSRESGEETEWFESKRVACTAVNGVAPWPLLIAEVHGSNTSNAYKVFQNHQPAHQPEWRRAPEFDAKVAELLGYSNKKGSPT